MDGAQIHVGDAMDKGEVTCICDSGYGWEVVLDNLHVYDAPSLRHRKQSVEELLREFARRWDDPMRYDSDEMVKRYANRLRLTDYGGGQHEPGA
jgi:hypothetical protein